MRLNSLPLLSLSAIVPFPGTPPYFLTAPAGFSNDSSTVVLAWGGACAASEERLSTVGVIACVQSLEDGVLCCKATRRCVITLPPLKSSELPLVDAELLEDELESSEAEACANMQEKLKTTLNELASLCDELELWPELDESAAPSEFSLMVAGMIDLEISAQQRLLEGTSTLNRFEDLENYIKPTLSFHAARLALKRLGAQLG